MPIDALKRSTGWPFTGTGSYARSCPPLPVRFAAQTIHTSALPDAVPFEVITGAPEPWPNESVELPASESDGAPLPETPYLYTSRLPPPLEPLEVGM